MYKLFIISDSNKNFFLSITSKEINFRFETMMRANDNSIFKKWINDLKIENRIDEISYKLIDTYETKKEAFQYLIKLKNKMIHQGFTSKNDIVGLNKKLRNPVSISLPRIKILNKYQQNIYNQISEILDKLMDNPEFLIYYTEEFFSKKKIILMKRIIINDLKRLVNYCLFLDIIEEWNDKYLKINDLYLSLHSMTGYNETKKIHYRFIDVIEIYQFIRKK